MTKADAVKVRKILQHVKDPDGHITGAIAILDKEIARYDAMRGQLRDQYDYDSRDHWFSNG